MPSKTERVTLTDYKLSQLKPAPAGARRMIYDQIVPSLAVRVTDAATTDGKAASVSFVVIGRRKGHRQTIYHRIGSYPNVKLAAARNAARTVLENFINGQHPREIAEAKRLDEAQRRKDTVGTVADEFIRRHVSNLRSARSTEAIIRHELLGQSPRRQKDADGKPVVEWVNDKDARWRDRPITSITRRDVVELVEKIIDRGSRHQARKAFAHASKLFGWALERDTYGLEGNPLSDVKVANLVGKPKKRTRVLEDDELRYVWRAAKRIGYPFGTLAQVLALDGQRLREISSARWPEIIGNVLTVPGERMKGKVAHTVPLTPAVLALLDTIPRFTDGDFIFSTTGGKRPVSGFSKAKAKLNQEIAKLRTEDGIKTPISPWTYHDLRRTARTRMSGLGVRPDIAEMVIAHRQTGIHEVYDLHTYDAEKRDALARWEHALLAIVEPKRAKEEEAENVVSAGEVEKRRKRKRKRA